jgi:hypothetical protein
MIATPISNTLLRSEIQRLLLISVFLLFSVNTQIFAKNNFEFTPKVKKAYDCALSLRFAEARSTILQIKLEDPENLIVYYIENYIDFFTVFINEDKEEFKALEKNKDYRLSKIKKGNKDSPYYLYVQAEIRLQWALARTKFEEYFTAFTEVKTAYKQLTKNQKLFPDFIANKKSLGMLHALVGTVPDSYKWGVKLLGGMDGTIEQGQREIKEIIDYASRHEFIFETETQVMYAFLMLHLKNQDEAAWDIINSGKLNCNDNPLACFVLANVAMRTGKNDEAISILQNRPTGSQFIPFHYLDFMLGLAKLYRQDADADFYIQRFVTNFKGRNYIKEAYQKLAWFDLLNNNKSGYYLNIALCRSKGEKSIEADKTALKEAKLGELPDKTLLKARLLFDGGYYQRAYNILKNKPEGSFYKKKFKLEYNYRLGRITHKLKRLGEAVIYYQKTIDDGREESYFFACNAALQIGHIYEELFQSKKAKEYYNLCLSLKPDEYRNGLHQKAKAGLNRLKS